jgi:tRNA(Ile)-lysidine synthase
MPCPIQLALAHFFSEHGRPNGRVVAAFSGGLDSSVLLHALSLFPDIDRSRLCAVHVDHGLHAQSQTWAQHAAQFAAQLSVSFHFERVEVIGVAEFGPEGAARRARYAAFTALLEPGDLLLTAHHADDQAETLLLRALRSAGLEGLAAMRPLRALGSARLGRPFLDTPRAEILDYAERHRLHWIEDPSNRNEQLDRNFLRHQVLPLIESRWPQARRALADSARHLRAAESAARCELDRRVDEARGSNKDRLKLNLLSRYNNEEKVTLIRHWLLACALSPPPPRVLDDLMQQLAHAKPDRNILVCWPGGELRRYRDELFALGLHKVASVQPNRDWLLPDPLDLGDGRRLCVEGRTSPRLLQVRTRIGGECLAIAANRPRRALRLLFQEHGVPPWERDLLPYLYFGDRLVAVGSQFLDHEFRHWLASHDATLVFQQG